MSGPPVRSAFGDRSQELGDAADILSEGIETDDSPAPTPDEGTPVEETAPEEEETPAEPTPDQPPVEVPPETPTEPPAELETPAEEAARLWAGKYATPDDLERGYNEMGRTIREHAEARRQAESQYTQLQQAVQAYVDSQQRQTTQPQAPQAAPEPTDAQLAQWNIDRDTYRQLAPIISQQVQAVVTPLSAQLTAEQQRLTQEATQRQQEAQAAFEADRARAEADQTIGGFYTTHPEYAAGQPGNEQLAALIQAWNQAWTGDPTGQAPGSFNVADPGALEIAAEAAKRPALAQILRYSANLIDDDEGMNLARQQAAILEATQRAQTQGKPATQTTGPAVPHTESGGSGAPPRPLDAAPRDAIDEIVQDDRNTKKTSVFARG